MPVNAISEVTGLQTALDAKVGGFTLTGNAGKSIVVNAGATAFELVHGQRWGTVGPYLINGRVTGAGTASIAVRNTSAGSLGEAIVIKFAVIKAVTA